MGLQHHCISFGPYFHFCLEQALETWAKASLTQSLRVHDPNHIHSLASFQWSGLSNHWALHLTENCLQIQKWCEGVHSWARVCRNGPANVVLLPAKAAAMCMGLRAKTRPPPLIPPFCKTYLQNGLHQLIHVTCSQSQTTPKAVIGG